jgi:hypothetical protein
MPQPTAAAPSKYVSAPPPPPPVACDDFDLSDGMEDGEVVAKGHAVSDVAAAAEAEAAEGVSNEDMIDTARLCAMLDAQPLANVTPVTPPASTTSVRPDIPTAPIISTKQPTMAGALPSKPTTGTTKSLKRRAAVARVLDMDAAPAAVAPPPPPPQVLSDPTGDGVMTPMDIDHDDGPAPAKRRRVTTAKAPAMVADHSDESDVDDADDGSAASMMAQSRERSGAGSTRGNTRRNQLLFGAARPIIKFEFAAPELARTWSSSDVTRELCTLPEVYNADTLHPASDFVIKFAAADCANYAMAERSYMFVFTPDERERPRTAAPPVFTSLRGHTRLLAQFGRGGRGSGCGRSVQPYYIARITISDNIPCDFAAILPPLLSAYTDSFRAVCTITVYGPGLAYGACIEPYTE